jgi:hypothetical protein
VLFEICIHYNESRNALTKNILHRKHRMMYPVHHVKIINSRKASKLDDKVKAINICDVVKNWWAVSEEMGVGRTQIMNILKRKRQPSIRIVLLFIKYLFLFICMFYSNHIRLRYFINNECKQE